VTSELSIHLEDPVSTKTVRREPHKSNIHGRPAIAKPLITENNAKRRKRLCIDHTTWTSDVWKYVIWSDESSFTLTVTSRRVYARRTPKKAWMPGSNCETWRRICDDLAAISWYSTGLNGELLAVTTWIF